MRQSTRSRVSSGERFSFEGGGVSCGGAGAAWDVKTPEKKPVAVRMRTSPVMSALRDLMILRYPFAEDAVCHGEYRSLLVRNGAGAGATTFDPDRSVRQAM